MKQLVLLLALQLSASILVSQKPEFEVATVKPTPPRDPKAEWNVHAVLCRGINNQNQMPDLPAGVPALGRCLISGSTFRTIMSIAYPSPSQSIPRNQRITGGPAWIDSDSFDIEGKAEDASTTTHEQLLSMLQNLLVDRFKLQFHLDPKEVQGFTLVVAKNGPKLKAGAGDSPGMFHYSSSSMFATNVTMNTLAAQLANRIGGTVIDQTGLDGSYDFTLPNNIGSDPTGSSVSTALQDELGLRLESQKVTIQIMVIDHVEKPPNNY